MTQLTQEMDQAVETEAGLWPVKPLREYRIPDFYSGPGEDPFGILEPWEQWWRDALERGYYLYGMPLKSAPATRVAVHNTKSARTAGGLINFASYNYLGLSYRKEVVNAAVNALERYGLGTGGAPVLCGTTDLHEQLAGDLAKFLGKPAALLFPTGFSANLGIIAGLMRPGDTVLADQRAHSSIVDGIRLAGIRPRFFRHNDAADLARKLRKSSGKKLVVVEGVYSMDGDAANLHEIVGVCRRHAVRIMIDEAHSLFVYGHNGRGVAEQAGVCEEMDIVMGTLSKTLGGMGGFVAGSWRFIEYLRVFANSRMFSGSLPPAMVAGVLKALDIVRGEPQLRAKLWRNTRLMRGYLDDAGINTGNSSSQIIPIMVGDYESAFAITEDLLDKGVYINPINYPAVAQNKSRLRMSITAEHGEADLEEGAQAIASVLAKHGKCR